ncbi:hypothetical protein RMS29_023770 (plasmid) [Agrobacterium rosae]|uniref:Uncharacterized protein n=1 Tax=Agrobacterium rosae TaxID=1972867 RepID=A0ABU4W1R2_9HYPH|nr:hypothetical protein [Agrobacterium rosae]MBN7809189.1 hypothetical protein [Agrobacterium rosae]MCM2435652.1 hypothetical protein [Agrobacterium rosae]MDX8331719.1 hypothetical protein [Agrobacterium rosae]
MSQPRSSTIATLDKLASVNWFRNVGEHDQKMVHYVRSWDEASRSCSASDWENLTLEATNQLRERIKEIDVKRLNEWNAVVRIVKPFAEALSEEKTSGIFSDNEIHQVILGCVKWDILHLCMEAEYSDIVEPAFFSSLSYYYFNGHFPCGFSGSFPDGQFIVY